MDSDNNVFARNRSGIVYTCNHGARAVSSVCIEHACFAAKIVETAEPKKKKHQQNREHKISELLSDDVSMDNIVACRTIHYIRS